MNAAVASGGGEVALEAVHAGIGNEARGVLEAIGEVRVRQGAQEVPEDRVAKDGVTGAKGDVRKGAGPAAGVVSGLENRNGPRSNCRTWK